MSHLVRNCASPLQCASFVNIVLYLIDAVFVGRSKICSGKP